MFMKIMTIFACVFTLGILFILCPMVFAPLMIILFFPSIALFTLILETGCLRLLRFFPAEALPLGMIIFSSLAWTFIIFLALKCLKKWNAFTKSFAEQQNRTANVKDEKIDDNK